MNNKIIFSFSLLLLLCLGSILPVDAQKQLSNDSLKLAAQDIINQANYCAFISIDSAGFPDVRTISPFSHPENFVVWFATSRYSTKVKEIEHNSKVAVYYADHSKGNGYVNIEGNAEVIDNKALLVKMKRDYWDGIPNWKELFVLVKIVPQRLEVVNYKYGTVNNVKTSKAPFIVFH